LRFLPKPYGVNELAAALEAAFDAPAKPTGLRISQ
jgi:hypothetical protein